MFARAKQYVSANISAIGKTFISLEHKTIESLYIIKNHSSLKAINSAIVWIRSTHNARNFINGFLQPVTHLPEALLIIKKSDKLRKVLIQTAHSTAPMLLISFSYYRFVRPAMLTFASEDSYEIGTMDIAVTLYLVKMIPRFTVQDTVNTASFSDAMIERIPQHLRHFHCDCSPPEKRLGDFNTNIHYLTHSILLELLSNQKYVGPIINCFVTPWFLGQTFLDYRLNMCDAHRYQQVASNNFFLIGVGASTQFAIWAIRGALGIQSQFSTLAIRVFIMKLGMLTTALREEPLPGNEYSFDSTYYLRYATKKCLQDSTNSIYKKLKTIQAAHGKKTLLIENDAMANQSYHDLKQKLSYIIAKLIGEDYSHLNSLVRTNEIRLLIQLKKNNLIVLLDTIQVAQNHPYFISAIEKITKLLPTYLLPSGVSKEELIFFKRVIYLNTVKQGLPIIAKLVNHALQDPEQLQRNEFVKRQKLLAVKQIVDDAAVRIVLDEILYKIEMREALGVGQEIALDHTVSDSVERISRENLSTFRDVDLQFFSVDHVRHHEIKSSNLPANIRNSDIFSDTRSTPILEYSILKAPVPGPRPSTYKQLRSEIKQVKKDVTKKIMRLFF